MLFIGSLFSVRPSKRLLLAALDHDFPFALAYLRLKLLLFIHSWYVAPTIGSLRILIKHA